MAMTSAVDGEAAPSFHHRPAGRTGRPVACGSDLVEKQETTGGIWSPNYLPVTLANLTIVAIAAFDGLALVAALPSIADDL